MKPIYRCFRPCFIALGLLALVFVFGCQGEGEVISVTEACDLYQKSGIDISDPMITELISRTCKQGFYGSSLVEGLHFETDILIGFTDTDSSFYYRESEHIVFDIGGIALICPDSQGNPVLPVLAKPYMTPLDLAVTATNPNPQVTDNCVVNMVRLTHALDANPLTTKVELSDAVHTAVALAATTGGFTTINFNLDPAVFGEDDDVEAILGAVGDPPLPPTEDAVESIVEATGSTPNLPRPLNDTGITLCGDYSFDGGSGVSQNNLDCSLPDPESDPIPPGQDALSGLDANPLTNSNSNGHAGFSFSKRDSSGKPLPASALSWDCVQDNVTGLMWEVKTDDGGTTDRDKNNTYTWYNTDSNENGGDAGTEDDGLDTCFGYNVADSSTYCNTEAYVARINAATLCGASDWRLPMAEELGGLVSLDRFNPPFDTTYFPNTALPAYWSASAWADHNISAIFVMTYEGHDMQATKLSSVNVRLVRASQ